MGCSCGQGKHATKAVEDPARFRAQSPVEDLARSVASNAWPKEEQEELQRLQPCQATAILQIRRQCSREHKKALPFLTERVEGLGFTVRDLENTLAYIRDRAPVIVHVDLEQYAAGLAVDSHYRNLFEVRDTTDGSIHAKSRMDWEDSLFKGAYRKAEPFDRCKYGVLNVTNDPQGVRRCAPVYGSSYLLLRGVRLRTTLSAEDSAELDASELATVDMYAHVLAKYTEEELRATLEVGTSMRPCVNSWWILAYKEAQIHGEVKLNEHVELVMAHPSLQESCQGILEELSAHCNAPLVWMEPAEPGDNQDARAINAGTYFEQTTDDEMLRLCLEQSLEEQELRLALEASSREAAAGQPST